MVKQGGPLRKTKEGRPPVWAGTEGYLLVKTVEEIQASERCSRTVAIKKAINREPILNECAAIRRLGDRTLQIRYQQAANHWSERRAASLKRKLDVANDAARQAYRNVRVLRGLLDTLEGRHYEDDPEDFL
jgi:hypothetical protein